MKLVDWLVAGVSVVIGVISAALVHALATRTDPPAADPQAGPDVGELERRELEGIEERAEERHTELEALAAVEDDEERAQALSAALNARRRS